MDGVKALFELFFVPDEEATNAKLSALKEKFSYVVTIAGFGEHLVNFLYTSAGTKAPVITVNLASYSGKFSSAYGVGAVTLDFSWYAPYKSTVDVLAAGIIYANWFWHMYKNLPSLINGQGMTTARMINISRSQPATKDVTQKESAKQEPAEEE